MPIAEIEIDSILGLTTKRNETSGINSPNWSSMSAWALENASAGATNPNSLFDCANIIISRNKQATARTAFTEVWDFTSTYGADDSFFTKGLYSIPNSTTDSLQFGWSNDTEANIANFTNSTDVQMKSTVNIIGNTVSSTFTGKEQLLPDFSWDTAASTPFKIKSFNLARFNTSYSNIYVFSSNGVFRTTAPYIADITVSAYNKFKRVTLPVVLNLTGQLTSAPATASRWLQPGYLVNIKVVVTDQLSGTQVYQGKPSKTLTLQNTGTLTSVQVTFAVDNTNILLSSGGIAVYRTISYLPSEAPPTNFYKCYEASLSAGSTSTKTTTFTNIELILNDTSLQGFELIYTITEGSVGVSAESSAPPTARDVVNYNSSIGNITVYGNVMCPPFAPLTMTALPNIDNLDILKVGATIAALTFTPNSTTPPSNDGTITAVSGTFKGTNTYVSGGGFNNGYRLVIRPQDTTTNSPAAASYSVPTYALADTLTIVTGTGSTQNIQIVPKAGAIFDITKFPPTGIIAVIQTTSSGNVIALFSYQSYEQVPASGWYLFSNCLAYGAAFSEYTWTDSLKTAGTYPIYALAGTSVTSLSVYAIGTDAAGYGSQTGFSLLPTYELYPIRPFNQQFVGTVSSVNVLFTSSAIATFPPIVASINFLGVYSKNSGQLLDSCVRNLCDTYNTARTPEDPYAVYVDSATAPVGQVRFESLYSGYNRASDYTTDDDYTSGFGFYDQIKAQVYRADASLPTVKFSEPILYHANGVGTQDNIMQQSVQTIAGLTASKVNKPEEIPIGQNLTPLIVGDPLKPIIKLINQYNQLLIFKQNEGTYRTDIQGGGGEGLLPVFNILTLIDNTAWLLLPESVQVFEGTTIYFSNKAFVSISSSGQVSQISPTIETELLNEYSIIYANNAVDSVRSFVITQQRIYCCYFPNVNPDSTSTIYVFSFNTGQWTKWTGEINDAVVSASGLLTLVDNIYSFTTVVQNNVELQQASINPLSKYWSVIRQADFQNPSQEQIEDVIPLTGMSVHSFVLQGNVTITITNFTETSVYKNLYNILMLYKNRTIWYNSATLGYFSTILSYTDLGESITLTLVDNIYNQTPIAPTGFDATANDSLITTVNSALFFNKFFISLPRGSKMSHYNEVQLYTQEGEDYTNLAIGFNSIEQVSELIYTGPNPDPPVSPPNAIITTSNGSYVVLNSSTYDIYSPYYVLSTSQYSFRALVPLSAARGRFIQLAILHDTPEQVFTLNSIVYIYRDLNSTKIKTHT